MSSAEENEGAAASCSHESGCPLILFHRAKPASEEPQAPSPHCAVKAEAPSYLHAKRKRAYAQTEQSGINPPPAQIKQSGIELCPPPNNPNRRRNPMARKRWRTALTTIGMISVLALSTATTAYADGWDKSNGQWIYTENGTTRKGWLQTSEGYYYMDPSTGYMCTGFKQINGTWYYFKPSGLMAAGCWVSDNGKWYYMLDNGSMVTGWLKITDQNNEASYYYMRGSGDMATGWRGMDNAWYYFQSNGKCVVNAWAKIEEEWYLFGEDGKMKTGWTKVNDDYYYLDTASGVMRTGWLTDSEGNQYYMDAGGKMSVGWEQIDNSWYYFSDSGHMMKGWILVSGKYYYLDPTSGKMAAGTSLSIGGSTYTFDASGACQNAAGVNAQNPDSSTTADTSNYGPGVSGSGPSSGGSGSSQSPGGSSSSPSGSSGSSSPGGGSSSQGLQPGRTDGPG